MSTIAPGSEMVTRVRAYDWSKTPLGPMTSWPKSLQTLVNHLLTQPSQ